MFKKVISFSFSFLFLLGIVLTAQAQTEEARLNIRRVFGYGAGSQIRGTFSADIIGPSAIKSVTYLIDGQVMSEISSAPFSLTFQTSQFPSGWHELSALVVTLDGKKINTPARRFEFVTSEQEATGMISLIGPILGGVFAVMLLGMGIQFLVFRNRPAATLPLGAARNYGLVGGGVCPHCHRAFGLHWWAPNLGFRTKFDRCDFCGKWSIVKLLNRSELATAETTELQMAQPAAVIEKKSEDERLKEMIEKSKYTN